MSLRHGTGGWSERGPPKTVPQKVQLGLQVAPSGREPGGRQWGSLCEGRLALACGRFGGLRELGRCRTCEGSRGMGTSEKRM
jgi:hypothetical protein